MKKLLYFAAIMAMVMACGKTEINKEENKGGDNSGGGGGEPERTEWTLTYYVCLPKATAAYMDVEISHKNASGTEVADGTLTASSTSDGALSSSLSAALATELASRPTIPDGVATQLIVKKISVGKVKESYKDVENALVVKIKLHDSIAENITTPTMMPFSLYEHEDRTFVGTLTCFVVSQKSPDLKTYLTQEASSGKKITDRNWGFDYIGL